MAIAITYARFSPRPNAEECDSIEKQEERCLAYCRQRVYKVVDTFEDPDTSGGVLDRPGLSAAIRAIENFKGEVVLVVDATDRLARDMLVNLTIQHEVERAGGRIEFANGTPVAETPEGRLFSNILAAFAAYERDRIRHATSRGMKRRQANGEWFGKPPVGWRRDPGNSKKLIKCPTEQAALGIMKYQAGLGRTSEEIRAMLQESCGNFRGKPWSARTVRRIIKQSQEGDCDGSKAIREE